jgi:hypothetical protein
MKSLGIKGKIMAMNPQTNPFQQTMDSLFSNIRSSSDTQAVSTDAMKALSLWNPALHSEISKLPADKQQQMVNQFANAVRTGEGLKALPVAEEAMRKEREAAAAAAAAAQPPARMRVTSFGRNFPRSGPVSTGEGGGGPVAPSGLIDQPWQL